MGYVLSFTVCIDMWYALLLGIDMGYALKTHNLVDCTSLQSWHLKLAHVRHFPGTNELSQERLLNEGYLA